MSRKLIFEKIAESEFLASDLEYAPGFYEASSDLLPTHVRS